jgi:hypothetical protein
LMPYAGTDDLVFPKKVQWESVQQFDPRAVFLLSNVTIIVTICCVLPKPDNSISRSQIPQSKQ